MVFHEVNSATGNCSNFAQPMATPQPSPSAYASSAWAPGKMKRIPCPGGTEIALESVRIQGIPAYVTPSWALEVPDAESLMTCADSLKLGGLTVIDLPAGAVVDAARWRAAGWHLQERHTRWLDLSSNLEMHLPKNRRKQLRRARATGFEVVPVPDMQILAKTHSASRNRKSVANDHVKLLGFLNQLNKAGEIKARGIRKSDGSWLATAGFVRSHNRWVYAFGGATEHTADSAAAIVLLLTEAMGEAWTAGMELFDFGGSADPGVDKFYAEFGARKVPRWRAVKARTWAKAWLKFRRPDLFA